jgi:hypothetical protein
MSGLLGSVASGATRTLAAILLRCPHVGCIGPDFDAKDAVDRAFCSVGCRDAYRAAAGDTASAASGSATSAPGHAPYTWSGALEQRFRKLVSTRDPHLPNRGMLGLADALMASLLFPSLTLRRTASEVSR